MSIAPGAPPAQRVGAEPPLRSRLSEPFTKTSIRGSSVWGLGISGSEKLANTHVPV